MHPAATSGAPQGARPGTGIPGGPLPPEYRRGGSAPDAHSPVNQLVPALIVTILLVLVVLMGWLMLRQGPAEPPPVDPFADTSSRATELPGGARTVEVLIEDDAEAVAEAVAGSTETSSSVPPAADFSSVRPVDASATSGSTGEPTASETDGEADAGRFVELDRREVSAAETDLQPGMIVGEQPRTRDAEQLELRPVDERRSQSEQAAAADVFPVERDGGKDTAGGPAVVVDETLATEPALRFLSAERQPLGVPLSLRVRADNFRATSVSVYYQWRGEGESGRRKRGLSLEADGSFALDIPSSELREDRLQLWFVAEPGSVLVGRPGSPIEVRVQ